MIDHPFVRPLRLLRGALLATVAMLLIVPGAGHRATALAKTRQSAPPTPVQLQIPSLHLVAPIESVGLADDGSMADPSGPDSVAWFAPGYLPGTPGNSVIAGHVDWVDRAAIFWYVRNLNAGDEVDVT